jgi:phosphoribosylanthranilate isomerase
MKLKICGMKYQENILEVAELQPDYLGFIFYEKSPRYFDGVIPKLQDNIKKVGVFVDEKLDDLILKAHKYKLYAVQLHGNESVEYCKTLRRIELYSITENQTKKKWQGSEIKIIKVFSIDDMFNFNQLEPYESVCDYYLFDTKGKLPGGNGYTFNWDVLKKYPSSKPYFLSGGIGLNEIETLKEFLKMPESQYCYAIDINSQFEVEAGLKDIEKLKKFKSELERHY